MVLTKTEEEFQLLRSVRLRQRLEGPGSAERSSCVVAVCAGAELADEVAPELQLPGGRALAGTLDVHAVRALPGHVLIGDTKNAAYLANVCVAPAARRSGLGTRLLAAARHTARAWGAEALYVHIMAVNEAGLAFYRRNGFTVEKEESANMAHYRGHCLDGEEGKGRTLLLRDTLL